MEDVIHKVLEDSWCFLKAKVMTRHSKWPSLVLKAISIRLLHGCTPDYRLHINPFWRKLWLPVYFRITQSWRGYRLGIVILNRPQWSTQSLSPPSFSITKKHAPAGAERQMNPFLHSPWYARFSGSNSGNTLSWGGVVTGKRSMWWP